MYIHMYSFVKVDTLVIGLFLLCLIMVLSFWRGERNVSQKCDWGTDIHLLFEIEPKILIPNQTGQKLEVYLSQHTRRKSARRK